MCVEGARATAKAAEQLYKNKQTKREREREGENRKGIVFGYKEWNCPAM